MRGGDFYPCLLIFKTLAFRAEWCFHLIIKVFCVGHCCWITTHVIYQSHRAAFPERGWPACRSLLCAERLVSGAKSIKPWWKILQWQKMAVPLKLHSEKIDRLHNSTSHLSFSLKPLHKSLWQSYILPPNLSNLITQQWVIAPLNVKAQTNTLDRVSLKPIKQALGWWHIVRTGGRAITHPSVGLYLLNVMSSGWPQRGLRTTNSQEGLHTCREQLIKKIILSCIMGNVGSSLFGAWTTKSQVILASLASF